MKSFQFLLFLMLVFSANIFAAPSIVKVTNVAGKWQLRVNGQPYIVKAVNYDSWRVGTCNDSWKNHLALNPNESDAWVDTNKNNIQDANEPSVGDFEIMRSLGVNAIRDFQNGNQSYADYTKFKPIFQAMYDTYGIMVIMNSFFGMYGVGGANYPVNYGNAADRASIMRSVTNVVRAYKDEPYILMWVLGNENNYNVGCNAANNPSYGTLLQEVALAIKSIDPNHPVANCDGDMGNINITKTAPALDIFGLNCYRGRTGFGNVFSTTKSQFDRPVLFLEYGGPWEQDHEIPNWDWWGNWVEFEKIQVATHSNCWSQIISESYLGTGVSGNAIGGTVAHYVDRWGEHGACNVQNNGDNGGLFGQGNGTQSPHMRVWRNVCTYYKRVWTDPSLFKNIQIEVLPSRTISTGAATIRFTAYTQVGSFVLKSVSPSGVTNILLNNPPGTSSNYQVSFPVSGATANGSWTLIATGQAGTYPIRLVQQMSVDTVSPNPATQVSVVEDAGKFIVSWTGQSDTGSGISHFEVYKSIDGVSYTLVAQVNDAVWTDSSSVSDLKVYYKVIAVDAAGNESAYSVVGEGRRTGKEYLLYPIPMKSGEMLTIGFNLKQESRVSVLIHDISGRLVREIVKNSEIDKGWQSILWDGKDLHGQKVGRGLYYCLIVNDKTETRRKIFITE